MKTLQLSFRNASFLLTLALALACLPVIWAAPFSKKIHFTQPDGTRIELWGQGDEFYAVFETLDGYTVVFDESPMAYCYARLSDAGEALISTGVQVQTANAETLGLIPHLRIDEEAVSNLVAQRRAVWDEGMGISQRWAARKAALAQAEADGVQFAPPSGQTVGLKVGLTLLIDFDDEVGTVPQAEIISFCNGDNYSGYGNNGSVKAYYAYNSNNKLTYTNVVTVYIRAPKEKTIYNDITKDAGAQGRTLIKDAIEAMKALPNYDTEILPKFDVLSTDSQNRVLALNVFYAGDNGGRWSYGLWPHSWVLASSIELSPGGKKVYFYQITDIGDKLSIGTFVHENGHMLCDYPDLYDYTGRSAGVGDWCLMASGSWGGSASNPGNNPSQICAYFKRASGWATTIDVDGTTSALATVASQPGTNFNTFYRFAKPGTTKEYFMIEARYKTNRDDSLPGSGVAVWHVDEQGSNSKVNLNPNTTHNNYETTLVQADGRWDLEKNRNSGDSRDLYYEGNSTSGYSNILSDASNPHAHWWDGKPSGLVLRGFSRIGTTMTFVIGTNDPAPVITQQPLSITAVPGQTVGFSAAANGFPPLSYQWMKEGAVLPGATSGTLSITNVQTTHAGGYSVVVSNQYGTIASSVAVLNVIPTVPLPYALNNSNQTWSIDLAQPWYGQTNVSHDGAASARSYFITNGQSTALRTTVTGPGTLSFWWKVSSQPEQDYLAFRYGSNEVDRISGEVGWGERTVYLPSGSQSVEWVYSKDQSVSSGQDQGWVDQVTYSAGPTLPFIVTQPAEQRSIGGSPVSFDVVANGTPPLSYQWLVNGSEITGATSSTLAFAAPVSSDMGLYSVRISNPHGSVISSNALLGVVPLAIAGDNSFGQLVISASATNAIALAAGAWHSLALTGDGRVLAWGNNWDGQCDVPGSLSGVIALAAGGYHSMVLKRDGTVTCWGANDVGQRTPPAGLKNVIAVSAGTAHNLALRTDGKVFAWGDNTWGQAIVPAGLGDVVAIAAGGNHNLVLRSDGTVAAWGENTDGQGFFAGQSVVPPNLANVVAIAAGEYHSLAVKGDGTVVAWGDNSQGQCLVPGGLSNVIGVSGGGSHSLALRANGAAAGWGANWNGQCNVSPALTNITAVAAGNAHTLVLLGGASNPVRALSASRSGTLFTVLAETSSGKRCALEYTDSLQSPVWISLPQIVGNGAPQFLVDRQATNPRRFYRIRQW